MSFPAFNNVEQTKEKSKTSGQSKQLPKDAQVIISILRWAFFLFFFYFCYKIFVYLNSDLGVEDFEPRVINQLLEFTYRYVTTILEDAK